MNAAALPSYASLVSVIVVVANLVTLWLVLLAMGKNRGSLADQGPPMLAGLSFVALALCYYNAIFPVEMSFWGAAVLGAMGLWGAWVDYARLSDHQKPVGKSGKAR